MGSRPVTVEQGYVTIGTVVDGARVVDAGFVVVVGITLKEELGSAEEPLLPGGRELPELGVPSNVDVGVTVAAVL